MRPGLPQDRLCRRTGRISWRYPVIGNIPHFALIKGLLLPLSLAAMADAGARVQLGKAASVLERLAQENTAATRAFTFEAGTLGSIPARVEDFHLRDGRLSMVGRAVESPNSDFILKGDARNLYGWVVLKDRNAAFEYTTDESGNLMVEAVPVEKIFPVCFTQSPAESGPVPALFSPEAPADSLHPHIGAYPGTDVTKLQSLPGAAKVMYLDITRIMNGATPKYMAAAEMWKAWQSQAAALSMYQVNVTTDPAVYAATPVTNSGIARFLDQQGRSNAPLNSFGTTRYSSHYRQTDGYGYGRITAHEVGHQLGLGHDGGSNGGEYFNGFSAFQWTPLMGNVWPGTSWAQALYQYSKGEYPTATRTQDDLALINKYLEYREDDIPGTTALKVVGSAVPAAMNRGQIARNNDSDSFAFRIAPAGGRVRLKINRIEYIGGAMLDVDARIVDAAGKVVAQSNKLKARDAEFDQSLPGGEYTLVIRGGAEGTPQNGFSRYSSLGFYAVEGTLEGVATGLPALAAAGKGIPIGSVGRQGLLHLDLPRDARVRRTTLFHPQGAIAFDTRSRVNSIDMSGLPAGRYLLHLDIDGQAHVEKILKPE